MQPRIEEIKERKMVGKKLSMSFIENRTRELWQGFMPQRGDIKQVIGKELYSLQVYGDSYFNDFNPKNTFEKWALAEVSEFTDLPEGMEPFVLTKGLYAVFHYKGSSNDNSIFQYIFRNWLPGSDYLLDHRPHFEVLGEKYKNGDPESEEEIWIPIRAKG